MKTGHLSKRIAGAIFGLTLICGLGLAGTANAQRRGRNWDGYPNWGGSYDLRQTALNAGYNEGDKEGRNDRNRNKHSSYSSFNEYEKATRDYSSKLGNKEMFQRYYREGYENGYGDGLNGY